MFKALLVFACGALMGFWSHYQLTLTSHDEMQYQTICEALRLVAQRGGISDKIIEGCMKRGVLIIPSMY